MVTEIWITKSFRKYQEKFQNQKTLTPLLSFVAQFVHGSQIFNAVHEVKMTEQTWLANNKV
jgi:hypothetical protein